MTLGVPVPPCFKKRIMIKTLRKRHLQIWALWALLIPVGIVVAWMAVPEKVTQELLQKENTEILPVALGTEAKKGKYYSLLLRNKQGSKYQLYWKPYNGSNYGHNIYSHKSFLIYLVRNSEQELIGRVGEYRPYYFDLPNDSSDTYVFVIYDPFNKKTIDSLKFNKAE